MSLSYLVTIRFFYIIFLLVIYIFKTYLSKKSKTVLVKKVKGRFEIFSLSITRVFRMAVERNGHNLL